MSNDELTLTFERLVARQSEFAADAGILVFPSGPEGVGGELEFAALVGTTLRLVPYAEL